jgi:hypothetical protein
MRLKTKAILFLLLTLSAPAIAAPLNGLYFGLDNLRGFAEVYWWFLPDGRVLRDTLPAGLTAEKFDAACREHSGFCGTYTVSGNKLTLQYKTGNSETWSYKPLNGGIQLNYLILTPVEKYPPGSKLNGTWERAFAANVRVAPGSNTAIVSPSFYTFKQDGTFTFQNITGVDSNSKTRGANITSSQQSQSAGTYTLHDNILMLVRNGSSEQHLVFPVSGGNLNIDGMVYKKR